VASRLGRAGAKSAGTLKGNKAHGRNERQVIGNDGGPQRTRQWRNALESTGPLGRRWLRHSATGDRGRCHQPRRYRQRQEVQGSQRCDAATGEGKSSKGVNRVAGNTRPARATARGAWWETRRTSQPSAGCNKPAALERRKPSRWCKTTRTEHDIGGWHRRSESASAEGVDAPMVERQRGVCGESQERRR
jgi:hypothetical protein